MPNNMFNGPFPPMQPGFGPDGDFKGKWISKKTGETVYVRDNIISDSGMQVMLSDGRLMGLNEFGNEFIRMSDEVYDQNGKVIDQSPVDEAEKIVPPYYPHPEHPMPPKPECHHHDDFVPPMSQEPEPNHCHHHHHHDFIPPVPPAQEFPNKPEDDAMFREGGHMYMIDSVFKKTANKPKLTPVLTVTTENFPKDQLQMLIDIFGVHTEDIGAYIYKNYFSPAKILGVIQDWLTNTIKLVPKEETPATPGDVGKDTSTNTDTNTNGTDEKPVTQPASPAIP